MKGYLKGFHLAIEMWRGGRDPEGWKLRDNSSIVSASSLASLDVTRAADHGFDIERSATYERGVTQQEEEIAAEYRIASQAGTEPLRAPPSGLTPTVPRLERDVAALLRLTDSELPPLRVNRPNAVVQVFYGFADAAGKGFGGTVAGAPLPQRQFSDVQVHSTGLRYRVGVWTAEEEEESSNYKELCNLVETAEDEAACGRLRDCEFFLCTDNGVSESCYYRGSSSSPKLHELIIRLKVLEMKYGVLVHIVHVSGKRMIAQGTLMDALALGAFS